MKLNQRFHERLLRSLTFSFLIVCSHFPGHSMAVDLDNPPINYWEGQPSDRFTQLIEQIQNGSIQYKGKTTQESLKNLLKLLDVPIESQVLVFSKTSAQISRIDPTRPRAIYFSDDCYVGWVQGGQVEILIYDNLKGGLLYLFDINSKDHLVTRPQTCLNCHMRSLTDNVPGGIVRSVFPDPSGMPHFNLGTFFVDHTTPIENRWGGWYVTGDSGENHHLGNIVTKISKDEEIRESLISSGKQRHVKSIENSIRTDSYLHGGQSDIVALMVLEHQVKMHNTLTYANLMVRQTKLRSDSFHKSLGESIPDEPQGTYKKVLKHQTQRVLKQMFFVDEVALKGSGIEGNEAFARAFLSNKKVSKDGRSLKDFRLYERIFKYRCSYMIYSDAFEFLPIKLKNEIFQQMYDALQPYSGSPLTNHMSQSEKKRIIQILRDTKSDIPDYWKL